MQRLRGALAKASVGLATVEQFTGPVDLPGVFPVLRLGTPPKPEEAKRLYTTWLHSALFRECIEALESLLAETWVVATVAELPGPHGRVHTSTLRRFQERLHDVQTRMTLGQKLNALSRDFPGLIPPPWSKILNGLVHFRNCLTHGRGIVRKRDLTSEKRLTLSWRFPELIFIDEDENIHRLADLIGSASPGGHLRRRIRVKRRYFRVGDQPTLSRDEFAELLLTHLQLAYDLRDHLLRNLQEKGVAPPELDLTPKFQIVTENLGPLATAIRHWASEIEPTHGNLEVHFPTNATTKPTAMSWARRARSTTIFAQPTLLTELGYWAQPRVSVCTSTGLSRLCLAISASRKAGSRAPSTRNPR